MKALSLTQPWATLVALGEKRVETRSWSTAYRGPIAIHASATLPKQAKVLMLCVPFYGVLTKHGHTISHMLMAPPPGIVPHDLPLGAVVAVANLTACIESENPMWRRGAFQNRPNEEAFGDFSPGRFMWFLSDVVALPEPIPARGSLGLWEWDAPAEVLALVKGRGHAAQE